MKTKPQIFKHKNKVYEWVGRYYLVPNNSGDVYEIVKGKVVYLPEMSTSTIKYYGTLVGKDYC